MECTRENRSRTYNMCIIDERVREKGADREKAIINI